MYMFYISYVANIQPITFKLEFEKTRPTAICMCKDECAAKRYLFVNIS